MERQTGGTVQPHCAKSDRLGRPSKSRADSGGGWRAAGSLFFSGEKLPYLGKKIVMGEKLFNPLGHFFFFDYRLVT